MMKVEQLIVEVNIFIPGTRIEGKLHLPPGGRLTDYLALVERKFIPVTDAKVYYMPANDLMYSIAFMSVNKDAIVYIFPKGQT